MCTINTICTGYVSVQAVLGATQKSKLVAGTCVAHTLSGLSFCLPVSGLSSAPPHPRCHRHRRRRSPRPRRPPPHPQTPQENHPSLNGAQSEAPHLPKSLTFACTTRPYFCSRSCTGSEESTPSGRRGGTLDERCRVGLNVQPSSSICSRSRSVISFLRLRSAGAYRGVRRWGAGVRDRNRTGFAFSCSHHKTNKGTQAPTREPESTGARVDGSHGLQLPPAP